MQRTWVLGPTGVRRVLSARRVLSVLSVLSVVAGISALSVPGVLVPRLGAPPNGQPPSADRVALTASLRAALDTATETASWHCTLPNRDRPDRFLGEPGPPPLLISEPATPPPASSFTPSSAATPGSTPGPAPGPAPGSSAALGVPGVGRAEAQPAPRPIPDFGTGSGQNPRGRLSGTLTSPDSANVFSFTLHAGEVFAATARDGAGMLELRDPSGTLVQGAAVDRSGIYPDSSPLLGGGNATVDHVVAVTGTHTLTVRRAPNAPAPEPASAGLPSSPGPPSTAEVPNTSGAPSGAPAEPGAAEPGGAPTASRSPSPAANSLTGPAAPVPSAAPTSTPRSGDGYRVDIGTFQPAPAPAQKIVLEFGGAKIDIRRFGVETANPEPTLSPLRTFLPGWGLQPGDEAALIARVTSTVRENLADTVGGTEVEVIDANRPDASTFGQSGVSRVVIGGSAAEAGIPTVGISESVDPGNFAREETALVLLDRLSGPTEDAISLGHYLKAPVERSARVDFVGRALGNIAAHEAGHFLGSWHTDAGSERHDLMAPGDVVGAFGFGADRLGGTTDDQRTRFGQDRYTPDEGFTGTEDTRNRTMVGLRGPADPNDG